MPRATYFTQTPWRNCTEGERLGVKRGTLLKVRHDGTALFILSFSSHISSQGMVCAIVATASAGMAGQGTLVKSGWERTTEEKWLLDIRDKRPGCLERPGATPQPDNNERKQNVYREINLFCLSLTILM